jgi:hypothetical protein
MHPASFSNIGSTFKKTVVNPPVCNYRAPADVELLDDMSGTWHVHLEGDKFNQNDMLEAV